jgi:glycosyltransferase involved in cell wall biosynthesis
MRILHLITSLDRGGAEAHLRDLIARQVGRGDKVVCAYLKGRGEWRPTLESLGVAVHDLGLRAYGDPRPLARLRALAAEHRAEVVHAHLQPGELYAAMAWNDRSRPPLVISRHNLGRFYKGPAPDALERWAVRRSDQVIAISEAAGERLRRVNPAYPGDRLSVVPYGVDLAPYDRGAEPQRTRLRTEWGLGPDSFAFGTVSRLIHSKRVDVLIDALAEARRQRPGRDIRLVVVGDGPVRPGLEARARERGVAEAVVFAGLRGDVPDCLFALDAFAFASVTEGFGLVLLEAMAAGLPVIATDLAPMNDVVTPNEGLLASVEDVGANAQAMIRLLDDPALAAQLGAAGQARAQTYSLDLMAERIEAVYRAAIVAAQARRRP